MRNLGDIATGRPNLGTEMPVEVYRLFENAVFEVLAREYGQERADDLVRQAGFESGRLTAEQHLDKNKEKEEFLQDVQELLSEMKIGILRVEKFNLEENEILLSVYEDLDCSGMPVTDDRICVYDEGFIAGLMTFYTGSEFTVREIDCWSSGDRVCRFKGHMNT
ncbi:MAG: 4-vinyl reductase [Clostridiales bacterium]|jgi:predicted hydrocarbon binding protein|nr:4-vinyl reductase [Clostridiales bacterium]